MRIYVKEGFNVNEVWNDIFNHIDNEMKEVLGNLYDTSIISDCKNYIDSNISTDKKLSHVNSTFKSLKNEPITVLENSNSVAASIIAHSFIGGIKIPFLGHLLDSIYSSSDDGKKKKQLQDMQKQYHENILGKGCTQENMNNIGKYGEDRIGADSKCLGDNGDLEGDGGNDDPTPENPGLGDPDTGGQEDGRSANGGGTEPDRPDNPVRYDPLALDLNHNDKIGTTSINGSDAYFDIGGNDGGIREQYGLAWRRRWLPCSRP